MTDPDPTITIVVIAIATIALLGWLWWQVPKWQLNSLKPKIPLDNPKERADSRRQLPQDFRSSARRSISPKPAPQPDFGYLILGIRNSRRACGSRAVTSIADNLEMGRPQLSKCPCLR
jgi:hypothetical protein